MTVRLVSSGWDRELADALATDHSTVRIVVPFMKRKAVERLLEAGSPGEFQVVTRFNLTNFSQGVSDIAALRLLLVNGATIRGLRDLHAKLYLVGGERAIVTSANLTEAGLTANHELGFVCSGAKSVAPCQRYFEGLWNLTSTDLTEERLDEWEQRINESLARSGPLANPQGLGDEGETGGIDRSRAPLPPWVNEAPQGFVKFFGRNLDRAQPANSVIEEMKRSGCHRICSYPRNKRPRRVQNGAMMFMGRLVRNPNDVLVFGRATALAYEAGRDDASEEEIALRSWKANWPHHVRVHHGQYLAGSLSNGVSLYELMDELGHDAFATTQDHSRAGHGNTNPRLAYPRQPDVRLSSDGQRWLNQRLDEAFAAHGLQGEADLAHLDWPTIPAT